MDLVLFEAEVFELGEGGVVRHKAEDEPFAVGAGSATDADIALLSFKGRAADVAVLGEAAFGDVHTRHEFHAGDDLRHHVGRQEHDVVQDTIDPESDAQSVFGGVEVDVGGVELEGPFEEQVDERRGADDVDQFPQFFLEGFLPTSAFVAMSSAETHGIRLRQKARCNRVNGLARHDRSPPCSARSPPSTIRGTICRRTGFYSKSSVRANFLTTDKTERIPHDCLLICPAEPSPNYRSPQSLPGGNWRQVITSTPSSLSSLDR